MGCDRKKLALRSMLFASRRAPLITSGLHFEDIPISPVLLGVVEELVSPVHKIF